MLPPDPLAGKYVLRCTADGCEGQTFATQNLGVGWKLGDRINMDPSNPSYARCPRCKRYNMEVAKVPQAPPPKPPKGFTKVPEK
jgi:hypothetical protein